jgi:hypothetical protein
VSISSIRFFLEMDAAFPKNILWGRPNTSGTGRTVQQVELNAPFPMTQAKSAPMACRSGQSPIISISRVVDMAVHSRSTRRITRITFAINSGTTWSALHPGCANGFHRSSRGNKGERAIHFRSRATCTASFRISASSVVDARHPTRHSLCHSD